MEEIKGFWNSIKEIDIQHWKTATWSMIFSLIFGLLPTWITMIMLRLFSKDIKFQNIIDEGQFAIYSAAFIAAGLYFVARDFKTTKFKGRQIFILILAVLLIAASLLVGGVAISGEVSLTIDCVFLRYMSIIIFCITIPVYYLCAARNEAGMAGDYKEFALGGYKKLEDKFKPPEGM